MRPVLWGLCGLQATAESMWPVVRHCGQALWSGTMVRPGRTLSKGGTDEVALQQKMSHSEGHRLTAGGPWRVQGCVLPSGGTWLPPRLPQIRAKMYQKSPSRPPDRADQGRITPWWCLLHWGAQVRARVRAACVHAECVHGECVSVCVRA